MSDKQILDATAGGRSIWMPEHKDSEDVLYIDKRREDPGFAGQEGRTYAVQPDEVQDFRNLPYEDESFHHVLFDPPHVIKENGMQNLAGYVEKSYGALSAETWQHDLQKGFNELWRVLKPAGTLVFKFADTHVDFRDVLELAPVQPRYGTRNLKSSKQETRFFVFVKGVKEDE